MTTMAALLGGVPLMVGTGTGSELRQPLGYTIVGGLMRLSVGAPFTGTPCSSKASLSALSAPQPPAGWL